MSTLLLWTFMLWMSMSMMVTSLGTREKRSDDGGPLEILVQQLSSQVNSLSAQLTAQSNAVNAKIAALESKTNTLDKTIAFYAFGTNDIQALGGHVLIFNHPLTNVGNAYDPVTGYFTAPVTGLYDFQVSILTNHPTSGYVVHVGLYADTQKVAQVLSDNRHSNGNYHQASTRAVLHLNAGAKVFVKNLDGSIGYYMSAPSAPYTCFSGILIKAD